jgi:hypothetical protein
MAGDDPQVGARHRTRIPSGESSIRPDRLARVGSDRRRRCRRMSAVSSLIALLGGESVNTGEATEKSHLSQPRDQGSPDHRQEKRTPANKPDRVG